MKVSNFKFVRLNGDNIINYELFATVDVTEDVQWWEFWKKPKTVTRAIRKESIEFWHFVDTGNFTPGLVVENLFRAYEAQHGKVMK
ncbi:hypothetical protein M0R04_04955 [Candidatus Dojkabacteria bacterium]|jgi:hypothetical protein|nr:hypothetical protein [Candidatus Dojkabacteria bacterium]